jgi:hypothetical protein
MAEVFSIIFYGGPEVILFPSGISEFSFLRLRWTGKKWTFLRELESFDLN